MTALTVTHPTLIANLWPARDRAALLRPIVLALAGCVLLTVSAKLRIPFYPVPMSMQTLAVLALGMAYGWRLGGATVLAYLAAGAAGLPVFAGTPENGLGVAYMLGTTGGYLLGFAIAAFVCGWLAERGWDRRMGTTALAMLVGNAIIYVPGLIWLGWLLGWDKPILEWGLYPFVLGDAVKLALATVALPLVWSRLGRRRAP